MKGMIAAMVGGIANAASIILRAIGIVPAGYFLLAFVVSLAFGVIMFVWFQGVALLNCGAVTIKTTSKNCTL